MPAKAINEEEFLNLLISPISARIVAAPIQIMMSFVPMILFGS